MSEEDFMQFSIIVPVYNVAPYLRQCVDSLLSQNYEDYEILLIDDGSTDDSGSICDEYAAQSDRIRVIHQENHGLSGARNTGLDHARGEWIVFVDSDDWVESDMLFLLNREMQRTRADVYCFNARKVSADGARTVEKLTFFIENDAFTLENEEQRYTFFAKQLMRYKFGWEVCFRVFRTELIRRYNLHFRPTQEVFAEDYLFSFQYLLHVRKIGWLCNYFYCYRQREDSLLGAKKLETILGRLHALAGYAYQDVRNQKKKKFIREFAGLYFHLLDYHIQYLMKEVPEEQLHLWLAELEKHPQHQRWMAEIRANKDAFGKYMVNRKWL